jgi:hypothetical protein
MRRTLPAATPGLPLDRERVDTAVEVEGAAGLGAAAWAPGPVSVRLEAGAGGVPEGGYVEMVDCSGSDAVADRARRGYEPTSLQSAFSCDVANLPSRPSAARRHPMLYAGNGGGEDSVVSLWRRRVFHTRCQRVRPRTHLLDGAADGKEPPPGACCVEARQRQPD